MKTPGPNYDAPQQQLNKPMLREISVHYIESWKLSLVETLWTILFLSVTTCAIVYSIDIPNAWRHIFCVKWEMYLAFVEWSKELQYVHKDSIQENHIIYFDEAEENINALIAYADVL